MPGSGAVARHARSGLGTSLLVALLVGVTVFAVAVAPRALATVATQQLQHELAEIPPTSLDLAGTGRIGFPTTNSRTTLDALVQFTDAAITGLPDRLESPLADGVGSADWLLREQPRTVTLSDGVTAASLTLVVDIRYADRVVFTEGNAPLPWLGDDEPIDMALSAQTAATLGLAVGDILELTPTPVRLTGTYDAVDPLAHYWNHAEDLITAELVEEAGSPPTIQASAYLAPESLVPMVDRFLEGGLTAWLAVDPSSFDYADIDELGMQVRNFTATPLSLPDFSELTLRSSLSEVLEKTREQVTAMSALIALSASGFAGVLLAAYALAIQALIRQRRTALGLASARGASPAQLRGTMSAEAAVIALPVSALAIFAAALLVPARIDAAGWALPAIAAVAPIALSALLTSPGSLRADRADLRSAGSSWRWIVEVAVVAAAAVALFLLQRRGLEASSAAVGVDPLLAATPLLTATALGLLALRFYPIPLRALERGLKRTVAAGLGAARAIREPAIGLLATLALVTGVSIIVLTLTMISTVAAGMAIAARDQVGADLQVSARNLPASLVQDIGTLPEIGDAVAITVNSGVAFVDEAGPSEVTVVTADTAALHAVRPDIPDLSAKVDGRLPVVVSADWADFIKGTDLRVVDSRALLVAVLPSTALPPLSRNWLLIDSSAVAELGLEGQVPVRVLATLAPGVSPGSAVNAVTGVVRADQPDRFVDTSRVVSAQSVLTGIRSAPIVAGLERALIAAAVGSLVLTMAIVALASASAAASRNRTVGVLRILGMSSRQIRTLVAWEVFPVAIAAITIGTGLGLALPFVVTSVLDLSGFVGGTVAPQPAFDPWWVAVAVAAFALATALSALVANALGRRLAPAGALKMGEG